MRARSRLSHHQPAHDRPRCGRRQDCGAIRLARGFALNVSQKPNSALPDAAMGSFPHGEETCATDLSSVYPAGTWAWRLVLPAAAAARQVAAAVLQRRAAVVADVRRRAAVEGGQRRPASEVCHALSRTVRL